MNYFEKVSKYSIMKMPERATTNSAGYDLAAAKDIYIPSLWQSVLMFYEVAEEKGTVIPDLTLPEIKTLMKPAHLSPILVPTGVKIHLEPNFYLSISSRSSLPLNSLLLVANAPGIIDADYFDNSSNEGEIFIQLINLSPFGINIRKGDKIAQGIITKFETTEEEEEILTSRTGGHGSTN